MSIINNKVRLSVKYLILTLILLVAVVWVVSFFTRMQINKRDLVRKKSLEKVLVAVGRYYLDLREKNGLDKAHFPIVTQKEGSWLKLSQELDKYIDNFPMEGKNGKSSYTYLSNGDKINSKKGACFILDVLLETNKETSTLGTDFGEEGCDKNNNLNCFYKTGIYKGADGERYYRLTGGGC